MIKIKELFNKILSEDTVFKTKLSDEIKRHMNVFSGRLITWFGSPGKMIVINSKYINSTVDNQYSQSKIAQLKELIDNNYQDETTNENIELECGYGSGEIVNFQSILEEQIDEYNDEFTMNYGNKPNASSIGDSEFDNYIGAEYLDETNLLGGDYDDRDVLDILNNNKFFLIYNKSVENLYHIINQKIGNNISDIDKEYINNFINIEKQLKEMVDNKDGDIGDFRITLRDGNHRTMTAIDMGEQYVAVDLVDDDVETFKDYINTLNYVNFVTYKHNS